MGGIEYYVEKYMEEHEGKSPLQVFVESGKSEYDPATPHDTPLTGHMQFTYKQEGWQDMTPEQRMAALKEGKGMWYLEYGGLFGWLQDVWDNLQTFGWGIGIGIVATFIIIVVLVLAIR